MAKHHNEHGDDSVRQVFAIIDDDFHLRRRCCFCIFRGGLRRDIDIVGCGGGIAVLLENTSIMMMETNARKRVVVCEVDPRRLSSSDRRRLDIIFMVDSMVESGDGDGDGSGGRWYCR